MIVHNDRRRGTFPEKRPKDLSRMHLDGHRRAPSDGHDAANLVTSIEGHGQEDLLATSEEPGQDEAIDLPALLEGPRPWPSPGRAQAPAEFPESNEGSRSRRTDTRCIEKLTEPCGRETLDPPEA